MRRVLLAIFLYLLLGLVTSAGIAWTCAATTSMSWTMGQRIGLRGDWALMEVRGRGGIMRFDGVYDPPDFDREMDVPRWSRFRRPLERDETMSMRSRHKRAIVEGGWGWPWPTLRHVWEGEVEDRPDPFEPFGLLGLPWRPTRLGMTGSVAMWGIAWFALSLLMAAPVRFVRWRRTLGGCCRTCGYQLVRIESDRCPECGHARDHRPPMISGRWLGLLTAALALMILLDALAAGLVFGRIKGPEAIHRAAFTGDVQRVERLLNRGVAPDRVVREGAAREGSTPLMWAGRGGHLEVMTLLLDRGADVNAVDARVASALWWAARANQTEAIALLAEHGAEIDLQDRFGYTALMIAAATPGNVAAVHALLDAGADVNRETFLVGRLRMTPLFPAASSGDAEIVATLLDAGADVHPFEDRSPIERAASSGSLEVVRLLVEAGAPVDDPKLRLVERAALGGNVQVVDYLLSHGAPIEGEPHEWEPPDLHAAVRRGSAEIFALLIERGADPEIRDPQGRTIWFETGWWRNPQLAELMLAHGPTVDARARDADTHEANSSLTPLMFHAERANERLVRLLLDFGAAPHLRDVHGRTAYDCARIAHNAGRLGVFYPASADDKRALNRIIAMLKEVTGER